MDTNFENIMEHIVVSIQTAGHKPYDQLYGYLKTGNAAYITRTGNARNIIKNLDCEQLKQYVDMLSHTR